MLPVGFEPTISAGERPQNYALDRSATGIGFRVRYKVLIRDEPPASDLNKLQRRREVKIWNVFKWQTQNFGPIDANNGEESISEICRSLIPFPHVKSGVEPVLKSDKPSVLAVLTSNV